MRLIYTSASISERLLFDDLSHVLINLRDTWIANFVALTQACHDLLQMSSVTWVSDALKEESFPPILASTACILLQETVYNKLSGPFFRLFESNEKYRYNSPFYQWHSHFWLFQILALVCSKGKNTIINLSITLYIYQHCYICPVDDLCPRTVFCVVLQEKGYPFQWHARPCQITGRIHSRRHETSQAKNVGNEAGE